METIWPNGFGRYGRAGAHGLQAVTGRMPSQKKVVADAQNSPQLLGHMKHQQRGN